MSFLSMGRKTLAAAGLTVVGIVVSGFAATAATGPDISVTQSEDCGTTYVTPTPAPTEDYLAFLGGDTVPALFSAGSSIEIGDAPGTDVVIKITSADETIVYFDGTFTVPACTPVPTPTPTPEPAKPAEKPAVKVQTDVTEAPRNDTGMIVGVAAATVALSAAGFGLRRRGATR